MLTFYVSRHCTYHHLLKTTKPAVLASLHRGTGSMSFYGHAAGTAVEGWLNSQRTRTTYCICVINLWLYIAVEVVDHGDSVIICSILQWEWWITVTVSPGCRPRGWAGHSGYTSASSARDRCTKTKMYLIHLLLRKVKYTLTKDQGCGSGSGSALIFPPGSGST